MPEILEEVKKYLLLHCIYYYTVYYYTEKVKKYLFVLAHGERARQMGIVLHHLDGKSLWQIAELLNDSEEL